MKLIDTESTVFTNVSINHLSNLGVQIALAHIPLIMTPFHTLKLVGVGFWEDKCFSHSSIESTNKPHNQRD
jgi:hypothetical protein